MQVLYFYLLLIMGKAEASLKQKLNYYQNFPELF